MAKLYNIKQGQDFDAGALTATSFTLNGIPFTGTNIGIPFTTGDYYFVDSNSGSDVNDGTDSGAPKATLDAAIGECTASNGDVIIVFHNHAETLTTKVTFDVIGLTVVGLGYGTSRPQFTVNAAIDGFDVTAADTTISGFYFNEATNAGVTSDVNIAAANCTLSNFHIDAGANDVDVVTVTAAGENPSFLGYEYVVTANGPDSAVKFEGVVDHPRCIGGTFIGSDGTNPVDDGLFDFNNVAVTNAEIHDNFFNGGGQTVTVFANIGSATSYGFGPNLYTGSATNGDTNVTITATTLAAGAIGASEIAADTILGADNANNAFASTSVVANADGSLIERLEHLQQLAAMAGFYGSANYFAVTADMTSATWNTQAAHEIATVTGAVRMLILPECTGTLTSAGNGATLILGDETTTNSLISSSDAENLATGEWWMDATITHTIATRTLMNGLEFVIANGKDIGYTIGGEALTGGSIVFHCWFSPLDATGAVVAGAGGVL